MSSALAKRVLDAIWSAGVRELCVCPGSRNAAWIECLKDEDSPFKVFWFYEERSAAFFALGRIKATGHPAAVLTTSGTAAGELLPATMEAHYSGLPLILMTADRPRRFRGSGAPQSAEQAGLFGVYTPTRFDLEADEPLFLNRPTGPVHINACFEDPQGAPSADPATLQSSKSVSELLERSRFPLVIVGQLDVSERPSVERFLGQLGVPTYFESLSGLRESSVLENLRIHVGDRLLTRLAAHRYPVDLVLRIGGVPTHRFWRDLEDRGACLPVLSVSRLPFSGLGRASSLINGQVESILEKAQTHRARPESEALLAADRLLRARLTKLLEEEPGSEPGIFRILSKRIENGSRVYLGNSLPIREWDLAASWEERGLDFYASRGLNGIDGQLSTFLGLCRPETPNWAILGDLTTLYDLSGPWPVAQLDPSIAAALVVVNNGGGKIFDRMYPHPEFQNPHMLSFEPWADLWGLSYQTCTQVEQIGPSLPGLRVVEIRPDPNATRRFWQRYEECFD